MLVPRPGPKYLALYSALAALTPTCMRIPSDDEVVPSPQAEESGAASTKLSRFASAASKVSSRICQSMDQESWRLGIGTGLRHLLQPQIHAHAHECCHQFQLLFADQCISTRQVREVSEESSPVIDFQEQ